MKRFGPLLTWPQSSQLRKNSSTQLLGIGNKHFAPYLYNIIVQAILWNILEYNMCNNNNKHIKIMHRPLKKECSQGSDTVFQKCCFWEPNAYMHSHGHSAVGKAGEGQLLGVGVSEGKRGKPLILSIIKIIFLKCCFLKSSYKHYSL